MRDKRLLAGAVAVAFLLAGTRWASYMGVPPLFVTDALVALAAIGYGLERLHHSDEQPTRHRGRAGGLLGFILAWVAVRFVVGDDLSSTSLRDVAPYAYIGLALLAGWSLRYVGPVGLERTRRILMAALWFHAAWFGIAVLVPSLTGILPAVGGNAIVPIFTPRPDVDSAVNGVFAGVLLVRIMRGRTRTPRLTALVLVAAIATVAVPSSRAGLLTVAAALSFAFLAAQASMGSRGRKMGAAVVVLAFMAAAVYIVPQLEVGQRLAGTFGDTTSAYSTQAAGTADARRNAWSQLSGWILDDDGRTLVGVGFGPNFMLDSGAIFGLVGENPDADSVRSPHNYWLGTWARLGLLGVLPILMLTLRALWAAWTGRRRTDDELFVVASLVVVAVTVVASFGVVLESPFGAVPFWWCVGLVLAGDRVQPTVEPAAARGRSRVSTT